MNNGMLKGQTALVTGASGGLGADFARQLAMRGADLVLVARRKEALIETAMDVINHFGVSALTIGMDLNTPDAPQELYDHLQAQGVQVDILVNNAGFGLFGDFIEIPWEREKSMLELDILTLTHMTKLFVKDMAARRRGYILQVSSIAAYQPTPTYASYCGAKAYVLNMGEALNYELRNTGVSVTVISPGITATEFFKVAGQPPTLYHRLVMMKSPDVARAGIESMLARKATVVPGWLNAFFAFGTRITSRRLQAAIAYLLMTR